MMRRFLAVLCVATLTVATLSACSWTQRGAAVGGAIGATTGGIWAFNAGQLSTAEGALVGLATGGLVGALAGDLLDQKEARDMQNELDDCRQELEAKKNLIDKQQQELEEQQAKLRACMEDLEAAQREIAELRKKLEEYDIRGEGGEIIISMLADTLYAPGKAQLTEEGKAELDRVMEVVRDQFPDRALMVRGHTDSQPIVYSGWKSNWELGAARALGVLHYLMDKHGVQGENISAATYSKYQPRADNGTAEGRQENRRAELVVLPKAKITVEPYQ